MEKTYGDVLDLAIEKSKGKVDVFVDYQAHVKQITIRIYPLGFEKRDQAGVIEHDGYLHNLYEGEGTTPQECIDFINNTLSDDIAEEHY